MTSILLCAIPSASHLAVDDETRCCPNLTFAIAYSNYHTKNNPVSSHFDFDKYNFIVLYLWIVKYMFCWLIASKPFLLLYLQTCLKSLSVSLSYGLM